MSDPQHMVPASGSDEDPVNILVLDDERDIRDVVEKSLTQLGYNVMTASEGSEGLQVLLSNRFDVVVSDLMMEPMDGITFLTEALRIRPWMGAVVFSGFITDELRQQALHLGVKQILEKPLSFSQLTRCVRKEVEHMRSRLEHQSNDTQDRVLYQLSMLRDSTRAALEATNLSEALLNLARDLGRALPSVATAVLSYHEKDTAPVLAVALRRDVPPSLVSAVEDLIRKRYETLSGTVLPENIACEITGKQEDPAAPGYDGPMLSFPIISGGVLSGILVFIPTPDYTLTDADISFLYHAANHLTTVLVAFYRIRQFAVRDELTALYNRHHLQDQLPAVWETANRYGLNPAFMIMDVDHFKLINDNYGHSAGDETLRTLADIAKKTFRGSDLIARYGGDEMVIVLPDAEPASLEKLAERMQDAIRQHVFYPETHAFRCTVSIGTASCRLPDGSLNSVEALMTHADEALYTAKRNGRNRVVIWHEDTPPSDEDEGEDFPVRPNIPSVMIVDDDASVLRIIEVLIKSEGFSVQTFENAENALDAFKANPPAFDLALVDLNLGDTNGLDLIHTMNEMNPFLVSIIITGDATLDNAISSLRRGAYDFIQKPIQRNQLKATLSRALEYHRLRRENEEYQQNLEAMVKRKSRALTDALKQTRDALDFTLRTMTAMLDAREQTTGSHSVRVQEITVMIAKDFDFSDKELDGIRQGALLHDIGKIGVPDRILLKEGSLTEDEWTIMRAHVNTGYDLIKSSPNLQSAAEIMLSHHEKFDGSGYPNGLQGEQIPLGARIFSIVDSYDAMRSTRPYRVGMSKNAAITELQEHAGTQFDPAIVEYFIQHIDAVEKIGKWDAAPTVPE